MSLTYNAKILLKRGYGDPSISLEIGEPGFDVSVNRLYIGTGIGNQAIPLLVESDISAGAVIVDEIIEDLSTNAYHFVKESSLSTDFYWNSNGDLEVSTGFGGATIEYVDSSLAIRDASITNLNNYNSIQDVSITNLSNSNLIQDASIINLNNYNSIQDASITNLSNSNLIQDASIINLNNSNLIQDASITNLNNYNSIQDASITNLSNSNLIQDVSITNLSNSNLIQDVSITNLSNSNLIQDVSITNLNNYNSIQDASIAAFEANDVTFEYVDSSLATRDSSIELLSSNKLNNSTDNFYGKLTFNGGLNSSDYISGIVNPLYEGALSIDSSLAIGINAPYIYFQSAADYTGKFLTIGEGGIINYTSLNLDTVKWEDISSSDQNIDTTTETEILNITIDQDISFGYASYYVNGSVPYWRTLTCRIYLDGDLINTESFTGQGDDIIFSDSYPIDGEGVTSGEEVSVTIQSDVDTYTIKTGSNVRVVKSSSSVTAEWGSITGDISEQIDLKNILDLKTSISYVDSSLGFRDISINDLYESKADESYIDYFFNVMSSARFPTGFVNYGNDSSIYVIGDTFHLEPYDISTSIFYNGIQKDVMSSSISIPNIEGFHYIYFDPSLNLVTSQSKSDFDGSMSVRVAITYWNSVDSETIYLCDQRHGIVMDVDTKHYLLHGDGLRYSYGLGLYDFSIGELYDDPTSDTEAQFAISEGLYHDQDLHYYIDDNAPLTTSLYYLIGAGAFRKNATSEFACFNYPSATGRLAYNKYTDGVGFSLEEAQEGYFVNTHLMSVSDTDSRVVNVMGNQEYETQEEARNGALSEIKFLLTLPGDAPTNRWKTIGTVTFLTSEEFTNTPKAKIVGDGLGHDWIDWRQTSVRTATEDEHGLLTGLDNDTHKQYTLLAGRQGDVLNIDSIQGRASSEIIFNNNTLNGIKVGSDPSSAVNKSYIDIYNEIQDISINLKADSSYVDGSILLINNRFDIIDTSILTLYDNSYIKESSLGTDFYWNGNVIDLSTSFKNKIDNASTDGYQPFYLKDNLLNTNFMRTLNPVNGLIVYGDGSTSILDTSIYVPGEYTYTGNSYQGNLNFHIPFLYLNSKLVGGKVSNVTSLSSASGVTQVAPVDASTELQADYYPWGISNWESDGSGSTLDLIDWVIFYQELGENIKSTFNIDVSGMGLSGPYAVYANYNNGTPIIELEQFIDRESYPDRAYLGHIGVSNNLVKIWHESPDLFGTDSMSRDRASYGVSDKRDGMDIYISDSSSLGITEGHYLLEGASFRNQDFYTNVFTGTPNEESISASSSLMLSEIDPSVGYTDSSITLYNDLTTFSNRYYDSSSGAYIDSLETGKFIISSIYIIDNGRISINRGGIYDTIDDAYGSISNFSATSPALNSLVTKLHPLLGYYIMQTDCSSLENPDEFVLIKTATDTLSGGSGGSGGGLIDGAINLGSGKEVYNQTLDKILQFRTLDSNSSELIITQDSNSILFDTSIKSYDASLNDLYDTKTDKSYVDSSLSAIDISINDLYDTKTDKSYVDSSLSARDASLDYIINNTYDKLYIDASLDSKLSADAVGELANCTIERTTDFVTSTTWSNITFDSTLVATDPTTLYLDPVNQDRIQIINSGTYYVTAKVVPTNGSSLRHEIRFILNDIDVIPGSDSFVDIYAGESHELTCSFSFIADDGDYISLQGLSESAATFQSNSGLVITKLDGIKGVDGVDGSTGPKGDPGSGVAINVADEGSVLSGPFEQLNFIGDNITAVANGTTADITVVDTDSVYGKEYQIASDTAITSSTATTEQTKVTLTSTDLPSGNYKLTAHWVGRHTPANSSAYFDVTQNGSPLGVVSEMEKEFKDVNNDEPMSRSYFLNLSGVQTFALRYWNESGTVTISDAHLELIRVS